MVPVATFLFPRAEAALAACPSFRVMLINVNTEHGSPSRVIEAISNENPDVVVLEEINDEWVKRLAPAMEGYTLQKMATRDDNFGIGLLSKMPSVSAEIVYIGSTEVPSVFAELTFEGRSLSLIATHPVPPSGRAYSSLRNEQLDEIARKAAAVQSPVLVLGDLNVTPWSYYYRRFIKVSGLRDSAKGRSLSPTWPTFSPLLWVQIDHFFHSAEFVIKARKVGTSLGSDHYPLTVDVAWSPHMKKPAFVCWGGAAGPAVLRLTHMAADGRGIFFSSHERDTFGRLRMTIPTVPPV